MSNNHPFTKDIDQRVAALGATTDDVVNVAEAPFDGDVESVEYIPDASWTGDNTNTRTLTITNKGAAGAGTTTVAQLALVTGVNGTAFDAKAITLSATPANLAVTAGDVLAFDSTHAASGLADPGGLLKITFRRDGASYPAE